MDLSKFFLNPWMLLGMLGLSLPILAHLLSKKRYDIVHWGAMQFLELNPNARRKLRLEQLLLLLLRMGLIALIVFALSRPFARGKWVSYFTPGTSRDVVLIVDGSYSMGWKGDQGTPHQLAQEKAEEFLSELNPGDTVTVIDAREQVRMVVASPTRDLNQVREALEQLPPPGGSTNLNAAVNKAINVLASTSNPSREIIVLTDGQSIGWKATDENLWLRVKDLREQMPIHPRLWIWDVIQSEQPEETTPALARENFSVGKLELSREVTVPDFPIRIKTKIHYHAPQDQDPKGQMVSLFVDGKKIPGQTEHVAMDPGGETSVEFEYRFPAAGSYVVSIIITGKKKDRLPGDDAAHAAVTVAKAIPMLLVEGNPHPIGNKTETHYLKAALSPSKLANPLIQSTVVSFDQFQARDLDHQDVVVLADVPQLTAAQIEALTSFVSKGGGMLIALGDGVQPDAYNQGFYNDGQGLLPVKLGPQQSPPMGTQSVKVRDASLELSWLERFRRDHDGEFDKVRFERWWQLDANPVAETGEQTTVLGKPIVGIRLETSDPLLVQRSFGKGSVMVLASPLDSESNWNTLRARQLTFVPLVYEMVFQLTTPDIIRNVESGTPLMVEVSTKWTGDDWVFTGPNHSEFVPQIQTVEDGRRFATLSETQIPGVYELHQKGNGDQAASEKFVVDYNREESNLAPLSTEERDLLGADDNTAFASDLDHLMDSMRDHSKTAELFRLFMVLFLAILVFEVLMTRKLVQGGHMDLEPKPETQPESTAEAEH